MQWNIGDCICMSISVYCVHCKLWICFPKVSSSNFDNAEIFSLRRVNKEVTMFSTKIIYSPEWFAVLDMKYIFPIGRYSLEKAING